MLQHVDIRGSYGNRQEAETQPRGRSKTLEQQPNRPQQFENAACQNRRSRPGDVRRHYFHLKVRGRKVGDAADEKPQKHETQTDQSGPRDPRRFTRPVKDDGAIPMFA